MAALGAHWTFADIVPTNLDTIRRVASLKGIEATFHLIGEDLSFDAATGDTNSVRIDAAYVTDTLQEAAGSQDLARYVL